MRADPPKRRRYTEPTPAPSAISSSSKRPTETRYISAAQFVRLFQDTRAGWKEDGLALFSGDVFSPSVESTITRGSHLVPLLNTLSLTASIIGNHDL